MKYENFDDDPLGFKLGINLIKGLCFVIIIAIIVFYFIITLNE